MGEQGTLKSVKLAEGVKLDGVKDLYIFLYTVILQEMNIRIFLQYTSTNYVIILLLYTSLL